MLHIHMLIDTTGSMRPRLPQTVAGINAYVEELKSSPEAESCRFNATMFNSDIRIATIFTDVALSEVGAVSEAALPCNGGTPLIDAVYDQAKKIKEAIHLATKPDAKFLMVVMTDGEENSSRRHKQEDLVEILDELRDSGRFTFVCLGQDIDMWHVGRNAGFASSMSLDNTRSYASADTVPLMRSAARGSATLASGVRGMSTQSFFDGTDDEVENDLVGTDEAARLIGYNPQTLRRWSRLKPEGKPQPASDIGGALGWSKSQLRDWKSGQ